jgi:hypothetical protein
VSRLSRLIDRSKRRECINRGARRKGKRSRVTCLLSSERATLGQTGLSTSGLAEDGRATGADDDCLGVGVDGGDGEATGALDIHEERSGGRDKVLRGVKSTYTAAFKRRDSNSEG